MGRDELFIDAIPTVHHRPTRPIETKYISLSVRRLIESHDIDTLKSTSQELPPQNRHQLTTPGIHLLPLNQLHLPPNHLPPPPSRNFAGLKTPLSTPLFNNTFEIKETLLDPPRVPKTAPMKFRKVPKVLYFPVLRAVETDRGGEFHHNHSEVERDPFLKTVLPGEVGFLRGQMKVIRDLVGIERGPLGDLYESKFRAEKATRHDIQVQVDELFKQTRDFMEFNCLDKETGRLAELWTGNRAVNRLETIEEKMDYLHAVFMWMVQGCFERTVWDGKESDGKNVKQKVLEETKESLHHSITTLFGLSKLKDEKNKLIESMKPPKPIPPGDIRSVGATIRRKEAAALRNVDPLAPVTVKKVLKNERHLEGATMEEVQRVRRILAHYHNEARIGKDQCDFRGNFVTPDSKSFIDWVREKEESLFDDSKRNEKNAKFSVRDFVSGFLKLQKATSIQNGTISPPRTPPRNIPKITRQSISGRRSTLGGKSRTPKHHVTLNEEAEIMSSNPILFARRRSGSKLRNDSTNKPLSFIGTIQQTLTPPTPSANTDAKNKNLPRRKSKSRSRSGSVNKQLSFASAVEQVLQTPNAEIKNKAVIMFASKLKSKASLGKRKSSRINSVKQLKSPAEIIAYKVPASGLWNIFHDEIVLIIRKSAWERSTEEIQILFNVLRCLPAFSKLSNFVVNEVCCSSLIFSEYQRNCPVFRQNDLAESWYILLTGSVNVMKTYTGNFKDEVKLRSLHQGQGFGDIGLMNDTIRSASIVTAERCEIIEVRKEDYNRVIKASHRRSQDEVANFLKSMYVFSAWKREALQTIASVMWFQIFEEGSMIIKEGDPCSEIYFIKEGAVALYKQIHYNGRPVQVKVGILGTRAILCSEAIVLQQQSAELSAKKPDDQVDNPYLLMGSGIPLEDHGAANENSTTPETSKRNSRFTIKAATEREANLLYAAYNLDLANDDKIKNCETEGMVMDFRDNYNLSKLETQHWVYEDLGDVVANAVGKEFREARNAIRKSNVVGPQKRPSMKAATTAMHSKVRKSGVVLTCSAASTARIELKNLGAPTELLEITEAECIKLHEARMERKKWQKFKKETMTGMMKEIRNDCQVDYGVVVGEDLKVNIDLWR
ncbi:UNVERIFIED_CONTAM: hypothetical protein HDU68_002683 [Siphonaria sp. JEL0065]|nr:hypothetical protein HDU68_002683 [Siphonaria sp. JEL0065]